VLVGKIQHRSVRLPGAAESVSVAGGGISSTEAGIPSAELTGIYCFQGRLGSLYTSTAGHHHYEGYKAGQNCLDTAVFLGIPISAVCKRFSSADMLVLFAL